MRSCSYRKFLFPLIALAVLLPACKKEAPPAPAPRQQAAAPAPAPATTPQAETPPAGEWEATPAPEGETFLSPEEINSRQLLHTIYFDTDRSEIRADQRATIQANAAWLRDHPTVRILVEGHCDERNTREYNMALGDRRARSTKDYLISLGIDAARIETISYGEERPAVQGTGEAVWQQNRRAEFVAVASGSGN